MLASQSLRNRLAQRRRAFTLLEVLVVVAILVILASVAGIYVFKQLEDAKKDKARMDMKTLDTVYKAWSIRHDEQLSSLEQLIPDLEQGPAALIDPWQKQYQFQYVNDNGKMRIVFFTTASDGEQIMWPRQ